MRVLLLGGFVLGGALLGPCSKSEDGAAPSSKASVTTTASASATPAAATTAASGAQCSIVGSFTGHVTTGHGPGTSKVKAGSDGSFSIAVTLEANNATTTLAGTYTTSGNEITVVNTSGTASNGAHINACPGVKGVYSLAWTADCKHVTWTKVSDSCPPREQEAGGVTLARD